MKALLRHIGTPEGQGEVIEIKKIKELRPFLKYNHNRLEIKKASSYDLYGFDEEFDIVITVTSE